MPTDHRARLATIKRFDQLIAYLRDGMGWPIARDSFEEVDDLFYDFTADELGIDPKTAAKIQEFKRLRPLTPSQPWGIFFVKFELLHAACAELPASLGGIAGLEPAARNPRARGWRRCRGNSDRHPGRGQREHRFRKNCEAHHGSARFMMSATWCGCRR